MLTNGWSTIRLVCAGLSLLLAAASASAECAWVLWTKNVIPAEEKWSVSSAHASQQQCQATLKEQITSTSKLNRVTVT